MTNTGNRNMVLGFCKNPNKHKKTNPPKSHGLRLPKYHNENPSIEKKMPCINPRLMCVKMM